MIIIGITGPIGSGKSYVGEIFADYGIPVIDTDKVYHQLVSSYTDTVKELEKEFGREVVAADGALDRAKLASIVFSDPKKLERLNVITHKYVAAKTEQLIDHYRERGSAAVAVEVPLMFESGFDKYCDTVLCVAADDKIRLKRIMLRNGICEEEAKKRIKNQKDNNFYIEKSEKVLYNNNGAEIKEEIYAWLNELLKNE